MFRALSSLILICLILPHGDPDAGRFVTASLGAAAGVPGPDGGPEELVTRADRALYRAKAADRERVETDGAM